MGEFLSIQEVMAQVEKFDGHIPAPQYDSRGEEKISSKIRRAVFAYAKQKELEKADPRLAEERRARMEQGAKEQREQINAEHEQRFWEEMPRALRAMGLKDQELETLAAMDESWPAWQAVKAWKAGTKAFLAMGGEPGTGKTIAAANLLCGCREFFKSESFEGQFWRPGLGRFVKASELARFSYFGQNDRHFLERISLVKWLVLDDLGAEQMSESWKATLGELIDARLRNGCRTVITTNLTGAQLFGAPDSPGRYGARIKRRIMDFGEVIAAKHPATGTTKKSEEEAA